MQTSNQPLGSRFIICFTHSYSVLCCFRGFRWSQGLSVAARTVDANRGKTITVVPSANIQSTTTTTTAIPIHIGVCLIAPVATSHVCRTEVNVSMGGYIAAVTVRMGGDMGKTVLSWGGVQNILQSGLCDHAQKVLRRGMCDHAQIYLPKLRKNVLSVWTLRLNCAINLVDISAFVGIVARNLWRGLAIDLVGISRNYVAAPSVASK